MLAAPVLADATATAAAQPNQLTHQEHFDLLDTVLHDKEFELTLARDKLARMTSPAYASGLLRDIIGGPLTPALKREMEYQAKHVAY